MCRISGEKPEKYRLFTRLRLFHKMLECVQPVMDRPFTRDLFF